MQNTVTYEVEIKRKFVKSWADRFFDGDFWWNVDTRINGVYVYDVNGCGWAKSLEKAKAKALKRILSIEKRIDNKEKFGVLVQTKGSAEEVKKVLET